MSFTNSFNASDRKRQRITRVGSRRMTRPTKQSPTAKGRKEKYWRNAMIERDDKVIIQKEPLFPFPFPLP